MKKKTIITWFKSSTVILFFMADITYFYVRIQTNIKNKKNDLNDYKWLNEFFDTFWSVSSRN